MTSTQPPFSELGLSKSVLKALNEVGYETPTPIQAQTIPLMLEGRDLLGQAQTGTGKTAAFALPILSTLDAKQKLPQVLVLVPTRELAIQVAEAFKTYAAGNKQFQVLPIYGGQEYSGQIRSLKRGVHVAVGTPGRVMDHIRRNTLDLSELKTLVLDEADEMLRMGFIDDVEWILEQTPDKRQIALFSATMPKPIRRIANKYLKDPQEITIEVKTATADTIRQRYWPVNNKSKLDALTRILEAETFDGIIIFVRTKTATVELSEKLEARGYACTPLNGDIAQNQRERTITRLKKGQLDIIVATDVAARGLDVERISHVINYDIPHDTESYIHRIGRTGRAGRSGEAILFITPREKRLLHSIEKATKKKIEVMEPPSTDMINDRRISRFKQNITETLQSEDINMFCQLIEEYHQEHDVEVVKIAAALARLTQGDEPFLLNKKLQTVDFSADNVRGDSNRKERRSSSRRDSNTTAEQGMTRYRIEVGHSHEVKPGNIVGAIANEGNIDSQFIGRIQIMDDHSFVDLPQGLSKDVIEKLRKARVAAQKLNLSPATDKPAARTRSSENKKPKRSRSKDNAADERQAPRKEGKKEKKKPSTKEKRLKKKVAERKEKKIRKSAAKKQNKDD